METNPSESGDELRQINTRRELSAFAAIPGDPL